MGFFSKRQNSDDILDIIKSYTAEQVLNDILTQFDSEKNELKIKIGECCEAIKQELV